MRESNTTLATLVLWLCWSWTVMTLTHEWGHVVGGVLSGGKLVAIEMRPWHLPYSLFQPDPRPIVTQWAGPLLGCLIPLAVAGIVGRPTLWFAAWFCVIANGCYLGLGYFSGDAQLDAQKLLASGTPAWLLLLVAGAASGLGYAKFRAAVVGLLSDTGRAMKPRACWISAWALVTVLVTQALLGILLT